MAVAAELVREKGKFFVKGSLLEAQAATTAGVWVPLHGVYPLSVTVEGAFVGTVKILVSNSPTKPADSFVDAPQLGDDVLSAPGAVTISAPYRWVKARVSAYTSGTISAYVVSG